MPYIRRLPKRGFNNARFRTEYVPVNLSDLEKHFEDGATVDVHPQDGRPRQWRWQSACKDFGQRQADQEIDRNAHKFSGRLKRRLKRPAEHARH